MKSPMGPTYVLVKVSITGQSSSTGASRVFKYSNSASNFGIGLGLTEKAQPPTPKFDTL